MGRGQEIFSGSQSTVLDESLYSSLRKMIQRGVDRRGSLVVESQLGGVIR